MCCYPFLSFLLCNSQSFTYCCICSAQIDVLFSSTLQPFEYFHKYTWFSCHKWCDHNLSFEHVHHKIPWQLSNRQFEHFRHEIPWPIICYVTPPGGDNFALWVCIFTYIFDPWFDAVGQYYHYISPRAPTTLLAGIVVMFKLLKNRGTTVATESGIENIQRMFGMTAIYIAR